MSKQTKKKSGQQRTKKKSGQQRTKKKIIKRMNKKRKEQGGMVLRFCNGNCPTVRKEQVGEIDVEKRLVPFIIVSSENIGTRVDLWDDTEYEEQLDINGASWERLNTFFKDHYKSVDSAIGRVENVRIEEEAIKADVIFSKDSDAEKIFRKYCDGILTDCSIGYTVEDVVITEKKDSLTHILVTKFSIKELSAVWMGFDEGAKVSRAKAIDNPTNTTRVDLLLKKLKLKTGV